MPENGQTDVRDMLMVHTMFRRELRLAPALVRGVAAGDTARANVLAEHVRLIDSILEHHHAAEDKRVWPLLLDRTAEAPAIVEVMERQHGGIDVALETVHARLSAWELTADPAQGEQLAAALEELVRLLVDHLAEEEARAVPLIERYLTPQEWAQVVAEGAQDMKPEQISLAFGMTSYEGDADVIRAILDGLPPEAQAALSSGAAAYAEYALRVHGTATPAMVGRP